MADSYRSEDQKVEAFSAPLSLLKLAQLKSAEKNMTRSGYYRYCLAKDLGYSEEDAITISRDIRMQKANNALRKQRSKRTRVVSSSRVLDRPVPAE